MPKVKPTGTVILLDGTEITVENKHLHHSADFLQFVCAYIGVADRDYFGLRYTNLKDGKMSWLDMNEPLVRQLKKAQGRRFKVGIQFFPDTIDMLQDEVTRYQFVLQTRENLLTGRWSCSMPTQALLASYVVQAEFHNYDIAKHGKDYLDGLQFAFGQTADFLEKVSLFHQNHGDTSPSDADWLYMKTARKMVMYGMDVYDVVDGDGNVLTLGMDVFGIHILFLNTILHTFVWVLISKICCHGKEVLITLKISENNHSEVMTVGFLLTTERDAKRVVKACNQNKDFHNLGAIKRISKNPSKKIECTHISTRILPKDFKRVTNMEFCKQFEKQTCECVVNGDSEETLDRKYSLGEESSKEEATTSEPELDTTKQQSEEEQGPLTNNHDTENCNGERDVNCEVNGVFISNGDLVETELLEPIVHLVNNIVDNVDTDNVFVTCDAEPDLIIPGEEGPVETSHVVIPAKEVPVETSDLVIHSEEKPVETSDHVVLAEEDPIETSELIIHADEQDVGTSNQVNGEEDPVDPSNVKAVINCDDNVGNENGTESDSFDNDMENGMDNVSTNVDLVSTRDEVSTDTCVQLNLVDNEKKDVERDIIIDNVVTDEIDLLILNEYEVI